jgi:hypothetical protein
MVPRLFYYQLLILGFLWLFIVVVKYMGDTFPLNL